MTEVDKIWKILEVIKVAEESLRKKNITNPRLNAELLLADILDTDRLYLYLNFEKPLLRSELSSFREKLKRRLNHEPLQYILGFTEFYGLRFKVNSSVLIPRQESEILVEQAIRFIKMRGNHQTKLLEIGTGSGCISISIAKNCDCLIDAIDNSEKSISIALENSKMNKTTSLVNFFVKDLNNIIDLDKYDLIVSNPPYIDITEYENLPEEIRVFEPKRALTDEKDGLCFYRQIFSLIVNAGKIIPTLLEIGDGKSRHIEKLLVESKIHKFEFHEDLMGIQRVLEIKSLMD